MSSFIPLSHYPVIPLPRYPVIPLSRYPVIPLSIIRYLLSHYPPMVITTRSWIMRLEDLDLDLRLDKRFRTALGLPYMVITTRSWIWDLRIWIWTSGLTKDSGPHWDYHIGKILQNQVDVGDVFLGGPLSGFLYLNGATPQKVFRFRD